MRINLHADTIQHLCLWTGVNTSCFKQWMLVESEFPAWFQLPIAHPSYSVARPITLGKAIIKVKDFNLGLGKDDHVNLTMHKVKTTDTDRFLSLNHSNQFLLTDDGLWDGFAILFLSISLPPLSHRFLPLFLSPNWNGRWRSNNTRRQHSTRTCFFHEGNVACGLSVRVLSLNVLLCFRRRRSRYIYNNS